MTVPIEDLRSLAKLVAAEQGLKSNDFIGNYLRVLQLQGDEKSFALWCKIAAMAYRLRKRK